LQSRLQSVAFSSASSLVENKLSLIVFPSHYVQHKRILDGDAEFLDELESQALISAVPKRLKRND